MIDGWITDDRKPYIRLQIRGSSSSWEPLDLLLDTGFSDYLSLPASLVAKLGMPVFDAQKVHLADGNEQEIFRHIGYIFWNGNERILPVVASAENVPALIGMAILNDHRVTLEVIYQGKISIEPLR